MTPEELAIEMFDALVMCEDRLSREGSVKSYHALEAARSAINEYRDLTGKDRVPFGEDTSPYP